MSPDTLSLFPDRPIRPLPKRKIREKLSPELADSIKYPPPAEQIVPLFIYPPHNSKEEGCHGSPVLHEEEPDEVFGAQHTTSNYGLEKNSTTALRNMFGTTSLAAPLNRGMHSQAFDTIGLSNQKPPVSTTSSVDGYDLLENANNKKKRKIPSAGDMAIASAQSFGGEVGELQQSTVLQYEPSNAKGGKDSPIPSAYSTAGAHASNIQGISGPGRGRLGRSLNGRSPLRALADGNNSWVGRPKSIMHQTTKEVRATGATGIISSAIANAEKPPPPGQENATSLLQHRSTTSKSTPSAGQFTFSCDSQVQGAIQWPGPSPHGGLGVETPLMAPAGRGTGVVNDGESQRQPAGGDSHNSRQKYRQRLERELSMAAQHRRQVAAQSYYNSTPKPQDIWICEFCEYERIFGKPPRALIRNYEIKDRQHRQEEADRKRLLEKAKSKSRKAKKNGKSMKLPVGTSAATEQPAAEPPTGESPETEQYQSTQSEYEYEDEFEDGDSRTLADRAPHCGEPV